MNDNELPNLPGGYTIEVFPLDDTRLRWGWKVRKHGVLQERWPRAHNSEQQARAAALAVVEDEVFAAPERERPAPSSYR